MTRSHRDEDRRGGPFPAVAHEVLSLAARDLAAAHPWIDAVYLFGSRARGDARPGSDIDVAMLPRATQFPADRLLAEGQLARWLEDRLGAPVDVILVHRGLAPGLLFDIFSVETILFARNAEQAHQAACRARAEYRDLRPRLERGFERVRRQIEERADALDRPRASAPASPE